MYQIVEKINHIKQAVQQLKEIFQETKLETLEVEYNNFEDDSQILLDVTKVIINDKIYIKDEYEDSSENSWYNIEEIEDTILDKSQLEKLSYVLNIFLSSYSEDDTETLVITKDDINSLNF